MTENKWRPDPATLEWAAGQVLAAGPALLTAIRAESFPSQVTGSLTRYVSMRDVERIFANLGTVWLLVALRGPL